jgi:hypothetical protein
VQVVVVDSPGCHSCEETHRVLRDLEEDGYPIEVTALGAHTSRGRTLMQEHRAAFTPLVLIDGVVAGQGGLSRRDMLTLLGV